MMAHLAAAGPVSDTGQLVRFTIVTTMLDGCPPDDARLSLPRTHRRLFMTDTPPASLTGRDGVLTVTFDRQDKLNAINPPMTALLWEAVRALQSQEDLRVLVIRAVGPYFTAGIDITHIDISERTPSQYRRDYVEHTRLYDELEAIDKPVVLAAQGPCFGAGVEMAVSCDFRFAADAATFQLPEINLAVIPGSGGISRLTRLVGPQWAKWLAMAAQPIDAARALTIGLVHEVWPVDELHDRVEAFANQLAGLPREAVGVAKLAVDLCANTDPASARHVEQLANAVLAFGDEHKRRVAAFNERRARHTDSDGG
jgi:enoyl-CoA hydratase/carnithine racemase